MILHADARALPLADATVQCVVTSPPYWGLRDYGIPGQIGLEPTPDAYVAVMVAVFREVRRVLRDDGTVWLNLGDSYAAGGKGGGGSFMAERRNAAWQKRSTLNGYRAAPAGLKQKDLVGIPWRVALALQADGWYLRSDIIWAKPNPMPESVTDRPTKSHEYLFLLTKSERYTYDADAIKEASVDPESKLGYSRACATDSLEKSSDAGYDGHRTRMGIKALKTSGKVFDTRNRRSVWNIATMPYVGAHFATMPEALVEPCILAGCPLGGLVLDPFLGSGTVGAVAERLGRRWAGCDLNPAYHRLAQTRTAQRGFRWDEVAV